MTLCNDFNALLTLSPDARVPLSLITGAGKTTSLKILAGELPITHGAVTYHLRQGDASLASVEDIERIRKHVGVCPQHNDSLHGEATCREMLTLFAKLKGNIPQSAGQSREEAIKAEVERRLEEIQFISTEDAGEFIARGIVVTYQSTFTLLRLNISFY